MIHLFPLIDCFTSNFPAALPCQGFAKSLSSQMTARI